MHPFDRSQISTTSGRQENEQRDANHVVYSVAQDRSKELSKSLKVGVAKNVPFASAYNQKK